MNAVKATLNVAPISFRRCPVHGQLVAADGEGRPLGTCAGCASEAARALTIIARGERY